MASGLYGVVILGCLVVSAFAANESQSNNGQQTSQPNGSNIKPEVGMEVLALYTDFVKVANYTFYLKTHSDAKDDATIKEQQQDVEKILQGVTASAGKAGDTQDARSGQDLYQTLTQTKSTDHTKLQDIYLQTEQVIVNVINFKLKNNK